MRPAWLAVALAGCPAPQVTPCVSGLWYIDRDFDGFGDPDTSEDGCDPGAGWVGSAGDCDDLDAARNPSASEACNLVDDDCDGAVDDGLATAWYADRDADGHGDPDSPATTCLPDASLVASSDDCDDLDPASFPGGVEVCDGRDNDCDGAIDDDAVGAELYYTDADFDGFGDPAIGVPECAPGPGDVADATDCDDGQPLVNPAAVEICDGRDDDCDGLVDDDDPDATGLLAWTADGDGDGWGAGPALASACAPPAGLAPPGDCDDANPDVSPFAAERCNGIDDDCDGFTDDADPDDVPPDRVTWDVDADGDGYGDDATGVLACNVPGRTSIGGDCDDNAPWLSPGATEVCSGIDEDCDGLVDEADPSLDPAGLLPYYLDLDGDGAGAGPVAGVACATAPGTSRDDLDCDDSNSLVGAPAPVEADADADGYGDGVPLPPDCNPAETVVLAGGPVDCLDGDPTAHPGAPEVCGDGVDQDCDGHDRLCHPALSGALDLAAVGVALTGPLAGDGAGTSVAGAGDVDADGFADVLVGAPLSAGGGGSVWVVHGPVDAPVVLGAALTGENTWDAAGSVAPLGDPDGDGLDDFAVGAPTFGTSPFFETGAAYVVAGPATEATLADVAIRIDGSTTGDEAGTSVLGPGDLDGDGVPDLAVGAPGRGGGSGQVGVFLGPLASTALSLADDRINGFTAGDRAGASLAAAGDSDGDGVGELWVGAPGALTGTGRAWRVEYLAGATPLSGVADVATGESAGDGFATAIAGPIDVDADGYDDAIFGAPGSDRAGADAGALYVVLGPAVGAIAAANADAIVEGGFAGSLAGAAVSTDGSSILVGAPATGSATDPGTAYLLVGVPLGTSSIASADAVFSGVIGESAGAAVAAAGDVDADGAGDWLVGAPSSANGTVFLLYGG